jgi:hypothetical protein
MNAAHPRQRAAGPYRGLAMIEDPSDAGATTRLEPEDGPV